MKRLVVAWIIIFLPIWALGIFILYVYISAFFIQEQAYYYTPLELYIKVYKPPFDNYGYVMLSKDSVPSFSEDVDYLKIRRTAIVNVKLVFNPTENNKIYIADRWDDIYINPVKFIMERVTWNDTIIYGTTTIPNSYSFSYLKPHYNEIAIDYYLNSITYRTYTSPGYIQLEPIE